MVRFVVLNNRTRFEFLRQIGETCEIGAIKLELVPSVTESSPACQVMSNVDGQWRERVLYAFLTSDARLSTANQL